MGPWCRGRRPGASVRVPRGPPAPVPSRAVRKHPPQICPRVHSLSAQTSNAMATSRLSLFSGHCTSASPRAQFMAHPAATRHTHARSLHRGLLGFVMSLIFTGVRRPAVGTYPNLMPPGLSFESTQPRPPIFLHMSRRIAQEDAGPKAGGSTRQKYLQLDTQSPPCLRCTTL